MNSNDMIVSTFLIGIIRLLRLGEISIDQAHFLIFCPGALSRIEENNDLKGLAPIITQALELEDILSILGIEKYQQELTQLEQILVKRLTFDGHEFL
ncbi:DUF3969 family protein [Psychrobacter alimentarius]|uniref:DUF3969 family protein n=1 Tax=Psychrobacter TaxID=497 RepID=UPI000BAB15FE|nr:DUF3969 family protein [Psychrobacter sp. JB193]PAT64907.1 hypothetical protein CIK80_07575 [Psychrobacter sp. JB193]